MGDFLELRGESRGEYFHIECASCGGPVSLTNLRRVGGVLQIEAECSSCELQWDFKLPPAQWAGTLENIKG